jgi:putative flippase GtrA
MSAGLIPILTIGFLGQVLYNLFLMENYYDKNTKGISLVTGSGLVINLLVTLFTVDRYGVYSIAWATAAGFIAWAIMGYVFSKKYFLNFIDLTTIFTGLIVIIPVLFMSIYTPLDAYMIRFITIIIGFGLIVMFNYKNFLRVFSLIRHKYV